MINIRVRMHPNITQVRNFLCTALFLKVGRHPLLIFLQSCHFGTREERTPCGELASPGSRRTVGGSKAGACVGGSHRDWSNAVADKGVPTLGGEELGSMTDLIDVGDRGGADTLVFSRRIPWSPPLGG